MQINELLKIAVERGASDLHLKVGSYPMMRLHGTLMPASEQKRLEQADTEAFLTNVLTPAVKEKFDQNQEADLAYSVPGLGRFRCNVFQQRGTIGLVLRVIPHRVSNIDELGLPAVLKTVSDEERGLVLVTGTTGSGKSTTLAAMIDHVNHHRPAHVITIEDPIEYLHRDHFSIINQREVAVDTRSFAYALRSALRQDPDVILIGELRDVETAQTALQAAESGHLVLSTMHTVDAAETIGRMIELFPAVKQQQIRSIMAGVLRGVISQRLLPRVDGGRVAAVEVMINNARIADLIRENRSEEVLDAIAEGEFFQMQTFTQALIEHVVAGRVERDVAADASTNRHDFTVALEKELKRKAVADAKAAKKQAEDQPGPTPLHPVESPASDEDEGFTGLRIARPAEG